MSLKQQITDDMKEYMKSKDVYALEAIRMLRSDIKNAEIDLKREYEDADVLKLIQSTIKKNNEAAEIYEKAGRDDLKDKENKYTETLKKYMPAQLSEAEVIKIAEDIVTELKTSQGSIDPKTDMGKVMKAVMAKVGSSADGKVVNMAVKKALGA